MSTLNATVMRKAQAAIKAGRKEEARVFLRLAIRQDSQDHRAWAWLAGITPSAKASLDYARRAQKLQPDDPLVRKVLDWAERRTQAAMPAQTVERTPAKTQHRRPRQGNAQNILEYSDPMKVGKSSGKPQRFRHFHFEKPTPIFLGNLRALLVRGGLVVLAIVTMLLAAAFVWDRLSEPATSNSAGELALAGTPVGLTVDEAATVLPPATTESRVASEPTATPTAAPRLFQAKNVASVSALNPASVPRATWTITPVATNTPTATPTHEPTFVSPPANEPASRPFGVAPAERWIDVDLETQALNAFEGDDLVFSSLISSGTWQHPTVTGQFRIYVRYTTQTMDGSQLGYNYYLENVPYVMYFYKDYALHGTYWHNNFGTPMSHGCVNMRTSDAEWIYSWSSIGTLVNVHY